MPVAGSSPYHQRVVTETDPTTPDSSDEDEHWDSLVRTVAGGRLRICPAGTDPLQAGSGWPRKYAKRGVAIAVLAGGSALAGWLFGSPLLGWILGILSVGGFLGILHVGRPEPFHAAYLGNKALFERSYLSGALLLLDTKKRVVHEYPTEWRRVVSEL